MTRSTSLALTVVGAATLLGVFSVRASTQVQGALPGFVRIQNSTPGTPQTGHSNITGTMIAGQLVGAGLRLSTGAAAGRFLASDASGNASWSLLPPPAGAAGGDLGGTYPNPLVTGIQGRAVSSTPPNAGQFLSWNGTTWAPTLLPPPSGAAEGDLGGNYPSPSVIALQGRGVSSAAPAANQVLKWNGSMWAPSADSFTVPLSLVTNAQSQTLLRLENTGGTSDSGSIFVKAVGIAGHFMATGGKGLRAEVTATIGSTVGGEFLVSSPSGAAVVGRASALTGSATGLYAESSSVSGFGVYGNALAGTGFATGVFGKAVSPDGIGVLGRSLATTGSGIGVQGDSTSPLGAAIVGRATSTTGNATGLYAESKADAGVGVFGNALSTAGVTTGVMGQTASADGTAVYGLSLATAGPTIAVKGKTSSRQGMAVYGEGPGIAVYGSSSESAGGYFVSNGTNAIAAVGSTSGPGGIGGFFSTSDANSLSALFQGGKGINLIGGGGNTTLSISPGKSFGVNTANAAQFDIPGTGNVLFWDNVHVNNTFTAGAKNFRIDHPLDPYNSFLQHGCVESDEYRNLYDGEVTTDSRGYATVTLPRWFEALNTKVRYQLTVVDEGTEEFVQAKVSKRLRDGLFSIRTSRPNTTVCWLVTGVRKDPYTQANPLQVEQEKGPALKGKLVHPEAFDARRGQP